MRRYGMAALGGTFDHLHVGHHALLASAFRVGRTVAVGVTTDEFVRDHPKPLAGRIQPFRVRRDVLRRWLRAHYPRRRWKVTPLADPFGRSTDPAVDVLVVSADTIRGGRAVNRERKKLGRRPIPMVAVPLVLADDLEPVSSRRIRAGVIDAKGSRRSRLRVRVSATTPLERNVARRAIRDVFPHPVFPLSGPVELTVRVDRDPRRGWVVSEASGRVRLPRYRVPGSEAEDLRRGLTRLLRPRL